MKISFLKLFFLIIFIFSCSYTYSQTFSIRPYSGYNLPVGDISEFWNGGIVFGTSIDYYFNKDIGVSLNFYYTNWNSEWNAEFTRMPISTNIKLRLPTSKSYEQPMNIYVIFGGGFHLTTYTHSYETFDYSGFNIKQTYEYSDDRWGVFGGFQFDFSKVFYL